MTRKDSTNEAFLSLGGNMGNRADNLKHARELISGLCGAITLQSPLYETAPWGHSSDNNYLNQVIKIETRLKPGLLMKTLLKIEKQVGRRRGKERYSDRVIDIDLLVYNQEVIQHRELIVPHPRLHLRKFVLVPFNDIAPTLVHPVLQKKIKQLLKECDDKLAVHRHKGKHKGLYICIEGNIGSGKTTLAKALAKKLGAGFLPEEFENNHLLPLFYNKPATYSFPLEYSFLISRFQQLKKAQQKELHVLVSDFSIYKCLWFAGVNLGKLEYKLFHKHFRAFSEHLGAPDLLVHLNTGMAQLKQNIKKRGRPYEQNIQVSYLKAVKHQYQRGISNLSHTKILEINIPDYSAKPEQEALKMIEKFIKENFGWQG